MKKKYFQKFKCEKIFNNRYKVTIFIKKFSVNIANILRKYLLSSIYGFNIKYFKLNGLKHQYCYINGILEDALEISLNFKKIFLKIKTKKLYLKLIKKGPCHFLSTDLAIRNLCSVLNKICICKIKTNSIFIFFIKIIKGKGYLKISNKKIGKKIYINNFFSPVLNVSYKIKKKKVSFDIETNGIINPIKAFMYANKYFIKNFYYIT